MNTFVELWNHAYRIYVAIYSIANVFINIFFTRFSTLVEPIDGVIGDIIDWVLSLGFTLDGIDYNLGSLSLFDFLIGVGLPVVVTVIIIGFIHKIRGE